MSTAHADDRVRKPPVIDEELRQLTEQFGTPLHRTVSVQADATALAYRFGDQGDRRAEVVFAIQDPNGAVWVHAKTNYPRHIYRLPSGGVHWDEAVHAALLREISEETGLDVTVERFLGLLEYRFHHGQLTAPFASYVFHVRSRGGVPQPQADESISEFRQVLPSQLLVMAAELRNLIGDRRHWGQWRALVHDLVYEALV